MTFKKLTEATKTKYTEADFAWDEKAMIAEYKAAVLDYMNGASMDDALKVIKAMLKSGGETIVKGKGRVRESKTAKIAKLKLHEEFKLYENMWDAQAADSVNANATGAIVKLGCATIDFSQAKTTDQIYIILEQAFDQYSEDWDTQISYGEFCTKFVPALQANPNVPAVVKKLFETATDIHSIVFNDCDDDILTVCYEALEYAGLDTDGCGVDEIAEFLSDYAVAYLTIENDKLYVQLSNPDSVELGNDFIEYMS